MAQRVAVSGAGGRLGREVVASFRAAGADVVPWSRPTYDLDQPETAAPAIAAGSPDLVVHTAAWTDVDGCALDPPLAHRRNALAVGALAEACARRSIGLVVISTNEVFDGTRTDGIGYTEDDPPNPGNPYAVSKLAGERLAIEAFGVTLAAPLWIVRTSWLFGAAGTDFPARIVAAADRLPAGEPLRVVNDEFATPTATADLAAAILTLVEATPGGTYHLVNGGHASRFEWAQRLLRGTGRATPIEPIAQREFHRPSTPPAWGVLATDRAASVGVSLRPWQDAVDDYLARSATTDAAQSARAVASGGLT